MADDAGFLSRWSRRKALVRQGVQPAEPVPAVPAVAPTAQATTAPAPPAEPPLAHLPASAAPAVQVPPAPPPPTLADVALLGRDSDYARFVAPGVDATVKNAALKQLFTDPHFNVMDGLDTYIDDYGRPDPLPPGMLRQLAQSRFLGLFDDDPAGAAADGEAVVAPPGAPATPAAARPADPAPPAQALSQVPPDEDAALRLQPHDAAGPTGAGGGAGPHPGRQH